MIKLEKYRQNLAIQGNKVWSYTTNVATIGNFNNITTQSATIIFEKNTHKRCAMFFYYIPRLKKWNYFVPTDSHINGMSCFANQKIEVERHNYKYNFDL